MSLAGHKRTLNHVAEAAPIDDPALADAFAAAWGSADLQEGMAAFRERRRPTFEGR